MIFYTGGSAFDDVGDLPNAGALVHVLVQPFAPHWQAKLLDEEDHVGVEGAEERENPVEELQGQEGGFRHESSLDVLEAAVQDREEAADGGVGHVAEWERRKNRGREGGAERLKSSVSYVEMDSWQQ